MDDDDDGPPTRVNERGVYIEQERIGIYNVDEALDGWATATVKEWGNWANKSS